MTTAEIDVGNDLVRIEPGSALSVFTSPNAIDPLLKRVRDEIDRFEADVSTSTGRKAIASMAYKVARTKTYLDDAGKRLADEQKEIPRKIDASRKRIRDTLDGWRDEVRAPLTEWETAEETRIQTHRAAIASITSRAGVAGLSADDIAARLATIESVEIGAACEEFVGEYAVAKDEAAKTLRSALVARQAYEAEQLELARLRAAEEERRRKDREDQIAREAAERAQRDAEAKAAAERKAAEDAARREREAAERRELELILQAEAAERRAVEAEAKARRDAEAKAAKEAQDAAKREADTAHRKRIDKAACDALIVGGLGSDTARLVIGLIAARKVPNINISY